MNQYNENDLLREKFLPTVRPVRINPIVNNTLPLRDSHRYQVLCDYRSSMAGADAYTINRVNFDFLLNSYNKYLDMKAENKRLKELLKVTEEFV